MAINFRWLQADPCDCDGGHTVGHTSGRFVGLWPTVKIQTNFDIGNGFIELFRNTPFMIQVFLLFYVLPFYGIRIPADIVGIIGLALFGSVYYAEIIRAGIDAIPRGQLESARSIGMSHWQSMTNIVLPQTMRIILPPIGNQTLSLVKESSILSTITVQELTMSALIVQGQTFRPFEVFIVITLLYWGINELIATSLRIYERRLKRRSTLVLAGTSSNQRLS